MTLVGMQYLTHQEAVRSNKAREAETERSNRSNEQIKIDDRLSRERIATADRLSHEGIEAANRLSREGIAANEVQAKRDIAQANIQSNEKIASMKDTTTRDIAAGQFESQAGSYGTAAYRMDPTIGEGAAAVLQTVGGLDKVAKYTDTIVNVASKTGAKTNTQGQTKSVQTQETRPLTQGQTIVDYDKRGNVRGTREITYNYQLP